MSEKISVGEEVIYTTVDGDERPAKCVEICGSVGARFDVEGDDPARLAGLYPATGPGTWRRP